MLLYGGIVNVIGNEGNKGMTGGTLIRYAVVEMQS